MPVNHAEFGDLVPYGDPSWYRNYNRHGRSSLHICAVAEVLRLPRR